MTLRFGIDLGGTKTEIAALSATGQIIYRQRSSTPANDYPAILATIAQLLQQAEKTLGATGSVGIGIPGSLNALGLVRNANTQSLNNQPLLHDLVHALNRPVRISNDANCFALSEALGGAGSDAHCVFGVILGTGTGGGIVINRQLLTGANAIGGEWGHNPLPWITDEERAHAQPCYCGKQGCIETYLSGVGFAQQFNVSHNTQLNSEGIMTLCQQGHPRAQHHFSNYCEQLAKALASIINIIDPDIIVLGGGMSNIQALYTEIPQRWQRYIFSDVINTRLVAAEYGDSSGVRGAAWLWNK